MTGGRKELKNVCKTDSVPSTPLSSTLADGLPLKPVTRSAPAYDTGLGCRFDGALDAECKSTIPACMNLRHWKLSHKLEFLW
jgi:hypothetical protein